MASTKMQDKPRYLFKAMIKGRGAYVFVISEHLHLSNGTDRVF